MLIAAGHDALSVDLLPTMKPGPHWQGDVWEFLKLHPAKTFDLIICHPECTYLTVSGLHHNKNNPERAAKTEVALEEIERLFALKCKRVYVENPVGCISSRIRKPNQIIQPYEFGEDASKKTCFWAGDYTDYTPLVPTMRKSGRIVDDNGTQRERWANQTDSGQNKLTPSDTRWLERSVTYPGVGAAMVYHWTDQNVRSKLWYLGFQVERLGREMAHG